MNKGVIKYQNGAVIKKKINTMKTTYNVKSDNYNHTHKFVRILDTEYYRFIPEESWMPIYLTYASDKSDVAFIDTEGGPILSVGWSNDEIKITEMFKVDNSIMFKLEEVENVLEQTN